MGKRISLLQERVLGWAWDAGGSILLTEVVQNWWRLKHGSGFNRLTVGAEQYNRIYAAASRSIERLRLKGLIRLFKEIVGPPVILIFLTDDGIKMASMLEKRDATQAQ